MGTGQWSCHLIDQPPPDYQGVLITSFDKILITVSRLTKNNGSVTLPLIDLTIIAITYSR
ncbi:hypothetical protein AF41_03949 [Citrobacter sp. MGH 55]|nr:hypothetical protein AF41_03949 [Citrobacter sp. MGH 55]GJK86060.1 hypothetical protein TUM17567_23550 [Citrobacter amalonaticus]